MAGINYSIRKNRLEKSYIAGFEPDEEGSRLYLSEDTGIHRLYIDVIDSAMDGCEWGRLSFNMQITEDMAVYVYAAATDFDTWYDDEGRTFFIADILRSDDVPDETKKRFFESEFGIRYVGKNDILLYGIKGRYLYIAVEITGTGEGYIDRIRVDRKGDNFMDAFPAVYRERNGFFHRFLSVFSSIYNDIGYEIDRLPELLDADKCPRECLRVYAGWLGIDISGDFLSEEAERTLVREAYDLNRTKGTKVCLARVLEIITGEKPIILENNTIKAYQEKGEMAESEFVSGSIYDVNILIRKPLSDTDRQQIMYLLAQFKPIRSRLHLIQLRDNPILDDQTYLDMNAVLSGETIGYMDDDMQLSDDIIMD